MYYAKYEKFSATIIECLAQMHATYKAELETWLNLKFQTFKNVNPQP